MATIEKRVTQSGTTYRVKIRTRGHSSSSASFKRRTDAKKWAALKESAILEGKYFKHSEGGRRTLSDAIRCYEEEKLVELKDPFNRLHHLSYWQNKLGSVLIADVDKTLILEHRLQLKKQLSNSTCNRYVATLSALLSYISRERNWIESNPCLNIPRLKEPRGRIRILSDQERGDLIKACKNSKYSEITPIVLIAITTGMRRSEILNLRWADISISNESIVILETKNGERRSVPLVGPALFALRKWSKIRPLNNDSLVFPSQVAGVTDKPFHLEHAWRLVKMEAGIENFRFHDLRHTAASYLAMNGAGLREIGDILGHKTLAMIQRYSHLTNDHKHQTVSRMVSSVFGEST
ncbi:site-specific integrase [Gammaproteobacteria bacterium]|nr:site-specific integrase [Gammaproteobacteria bacterium]